MAVRVRKLARELDRSPEDVLRLLTGTLQLARFRSVDDMVPDEVVGQVRKVARHVPPRAVDPGARPPEDDPRANSPNPSLPPTNALGDLMSHLVPGVVRAGAVASRNGPRSVPPTAAPSPPMGAGVPTARNDPSPAPAPPRAPTFLADQRAEDARAALAQERARLEVTRDEIVAARAELEEARRQLEASRLAVVAEREALAAARSAREVDVHRRSLQGLLEERGLRGSDEITRAVVALAQSGAFVKVLATLVPADADAVRRLLHERLVLVSGPTPESVGPAVTVPPERADLRAGPELERLLGRLSESWLLDGARRVALVGVPLRFQALLREHVDRRVELVFRAGGARDARLAEEDVRAGDAVVLWNVETSPAANEVYDRSRRVRAVTGRSVTEVLERLAAFGAARPV